MLQVVFDKNQHTLDKKPYFKHDFEQCLFIDRGHFSSLIYYANVVVGVFTDFNGATYEICVKKSLCRSNFIESFSTYVQHVVKVLKSRLF